MQKSLLRKSVSLREIFASWTGFFTHTHTHTLVSLISVKYRGRYASASNRHTKTAHTHTFPIMVMHPEKGGLQHSVCESACIHFDIKHTDTDTHIYIYIRI